MVPTFTCGFLRSNLALAIAGSFWSYDRTARAKARARCAYVESLRLGEERRVTADEAAAAPAVAVLFRDAIGLFPSTITTLSTLAKRPWARRPAAENSLASLSRNEFCPLAIGSGQPDPPSAAALGATESLRIPPVPAAIARPLGGCAVLPQTVDLRASARESKTTKARC